MSAETTDLEAGPTFPASWGQPPADARERVAWLRDRISSAGGRIRVVHGEEHAVPPDGGYRSGYGGRRTLPGRLARQLVELARLAEEPTATMSGMDARRALERLYAGPLTGGEGGSNGGNTGGLLAGPLPVHSTETSDSTWPGGQSQVAKLGPSPTHTKLSAISAWADPTAETSHRYVHHFVDHTGRIGPASVQAAKLGIEHLNGPRSKQTTPESDRIGVHRHLARHLQDAGRPVPPLEDLTD